MRILICFEAKRYQADGFLAEGSTWWTSSEGTALARRLAVANRWVPERDNVALSQFSVRINHNLSFGSMLFSKALTRLSNPKEIWWQNSWTIFLKMKIGAFSLAPNSYTGALPVIRFESRLAERKGCRRLPTFSQERNIPMLVRGQLWLWYQWFISRAAFYRFATLFHGLVRGRRKCGNSPYLNFSGWGQHSKTYGLACNNGLFSFVFCVWPSFSAPSNPPPSGML